MTADLTVGPMIEGTYTHGGVALSETLFHLPAVKIGLDNIGGRPVLVIGDNDGPPEGLPLLLYSIDILPEPQGELITTLLEGQFIVSRRNVQVFADAVVPIPYCLGISPVRSTITDL